MARRVCERNDMKKYLRFETILLGSAMLLTVIIAALRILALVTGYDTDVGYYAKGNGYRIAADILSGLYAAAALTLSIISCFGKLTPLGDPPQARRSAILLGVVFSFFVAYATIEALSLRVGGWQALLIGCIFLLGGVAYCMLTYFLPTRMSAVRAICAMCVVCFGICYAIYYYFLNTLPINGPLKIQHIFAAISLFMFFLTEAQRTLGLGRGIRQRFFTLVCVMLCGTVALPELYALLFCREAAFESFAHPLLLLGVGLYALTRLSVTRQTEPQAAKAEVPLTDDVSGEPIEVIKSEDK